MKSLILDTSPKVLARHITLFDINLIRIVGNHDLGYGLFSGLELITLPEGSFLRQDVIERYCRMALENCDLFSETLFCGVYQFI